MLDILVINGPNLNLLGRREPQLYGTETLSTINDGLKAAAVKTGLEISFTQSNSEGILLDAVQAAPQAGVRFIIINPGALAHTSIALRDALLGVAVPFVEVHLSNIYKRESFRRRSYLADIAAGVISGLGAAGYFFALQYARDFLAAVTAAPAADK